jgi:hypothetical protein
MGLAVHLHWPPQTLTRFTAKDLKFWVTELHTYYEDS